LYITVGIADWTQAVVGILVELSVEDGIVAAVVNEPSVVLLKLFVPSQVLFNGRRSTSPEIADWTQAVVGIFVELSVEDGIVAAVVNEPSVVLLKLFVPSQVLSNGRRSTSPEIADWTHAVVGIFVELSVEDGIVAAVVNEPSVVLLKLFVPSQVLFNGRRSTSPEIADWTQAVVGILVELSVEDGIVAAVVNEPSVVLLKLFVPSQLLSEYVPSEADII
jgi:Zn-dependent protease with chaperone function